MTYTDRRSHRAPKTAVLILALFATTPFAMAASGDNVCNLTILYPLEGDTVRHDVIPVWIETESPNSLERIRATLNGSDFTRELAPGSFRRGGEFRALTHVRPRHGENRLVVSCGEQTHAIEFRFEPEPMRVRIRVSSHGEPVPARVSFHGLGETADPRLAPPIWREIPTGKHKREHERNFVYAEQGIVDLHLPTGRYEVYASRGPAYSLDRAEIGPEESSAEMQIERVLQTEGWVSADFHAHAMPSKDSDLPLWDRVRSFVAQDVDVIVASDHDSVTDYAEDLGDAHLLPARFAAIPGVETSLKKSKTRPAVRGHWNFWPLARAKDDTVLTSIRPREASSVSELFDAMQHYNQQAREDRFGDEPVVVQLNHPRGIQFLPGIEPGSAHGHFGRIGYRPEFPLSATENGKLLARPRPDLPRPIDVDSIELLNRLAFGLYIETRDDWMSWTRQGFVTTAVANTDSHAFVITEAGFPRNWVRYSGALPVDAATLARSVRARQVVGTTGPLIEIEPWSKTGEPVPGPIERLSITVQSPAWMPIEEVRVHVGGKLIETIPITGKRLDPLSRERYLHRLEIPLSIPGNSFVVVEAGDRVETLLDPVPHDGPLGVAFPAVKILAFTNALLIEAPGGSTP